MEETIVIIIRELSEIFNEPKKKFEFLTNIELRDAEMLYGLIKMLYNEKLTARVYFYDIMGRYCALSHKDPIKEIYSYRY